MAVFPLVVIIIIICTKGDLCFCIYVPVIIVNDFVL